MEKQRYAFIDILRIIACFLVIVNHTNSQIFLNSTPSATWFVSLTYFFISKVAVPVFVMISGFTMLDRQDDYGKVIKKVVRAGLALLLFSLVYYLNTYYMGAGAGIGVVHFLLTVFSGPVTNAFWYMYLYIGLLIMLPFVQKFVSALDKKDCQIYLCISLVVFSIWPILEHIKPALAYSKFATFPIFDSYLCLLLAGHYLKKYVEPTKIKMILSIVGFILALVFNVVMTYVEYHNTGGVNYLFYDNRIYFPIVLQSICLFYMISQIHIGESLEKILKVIGGCTFGIYLISDFFVEKLVYIYNNLCAQGWYPLFAVIVYELAVFAIGFVITFILKLIPGIKKIV